MKKLFLCATSDPLDRRFGGMKHMACWAETAEEACEEFRRVRRPRMKWQAYAVEITDELKQQYPWIKGIPVSVPGRKFGDVRIT